MRVRIFAAALAATALITALPHAARAQQPAPARTAPVLPAGHWAYRSVTALQERKLMGALGNGGSDTKSLHSRYEVALGVARASDRMLPAPGAPLAGRPPSLYAYSQLRRLAEEFAPELTALGVDVNTVRTRLDARLGRQPAETPRRFADVSQNHWAFDAVESARVLGILRGYPDGTF